MKVILFSGKAEHGKTTAAKALEAILKEKGFKAEIIPLAKRLKEQARMLGWDGQKDERGRTILQQLSWPIKNYHGIDVYAKWVFEEAEEKGLEYLLIDDARMMAEVDYFNGKKPEHDVSIVRIVRPDYTSSLTPEQLADVSETQLDNYNFDLYVVNDSTPEKLGREVYNYLKREY